MGSSSYAQAVATASKPLDLSAFVGGSFVRTGLDGSHNGTIVAGLSVVGPMRLGLHPGVEIRGSVPLTNGGVNNERNILVALKVVSFRRLSPYADFICGAGKIRYDPARLNPDSSFAYTYSTTAVIGFGGGLSLRMSPMLGVRLDAQLERYGSPVVASERLYSAPITIGLELHLP